MALKLKRKNKEPSTSREEIRRAAVTLFAEKGLDGTTVRDIADKAGANLCLISYYFGGKEGLYRECIEEYGKLRLHLVREIASPAKTVDEFRRILKEMIEAMLQSYADNPELSRMLSREIERGLPISRDVFENTFLVAMRTLISFLEDSQKRGFVKKELQACVLALIIQSTVANLVRTSAVTKRYFSLSIFAPEDRKKVAETILESVFHGIIEAKHAF